MRSRRLSRNIGLLVMSLLVLALMMPALARDGDSGETVSAVLGGVTISGFTFEPSGPEIEEGETLKFVNLTGAPHTLSVDPIGSKDRGGFDSGVVNPDGETIVATDHLRAGEYDFFCRVHPDMEGTLTVK